MNLVPTHGTILLSSHSLLQWKPLYSLSNLFKNLGSESKHGCGGSALTHMHVVPGPTHHGNLSLISREERTIPAEWSAITKFWFDDGRTFNWKMQAFLFQLNQLN